MVRQKNTNKIELLSPAGNMEKLKTALAFGADAVYAGIPDFSLRVRINDFNLSKIREATDYCHKAGKKIYITANIFAHNRHLEKTPVYIKSLKSLHVDGLILSDPGILRIVKKLWPEADVHLSTQANCTNWQSAVFWAEQGVSRIILGREVTLEEIKEIHRRCPTLELEYFVHGAMCMAYSGRCFLSKHLRDRSANLGDCAQPCRWPYKVGQKVSREESSDYKQGYINLLKEKDGLYEIVEEEHGSYILNSKDLCLIHHLDKLKEAGVSCFKIEGRAKSVYYQAMVAGIYSRALSHKQATARDEIDFLYKELENKLVHRGYTAGFLLGESADQNLANSHNTSDWEFCGQVVYNYEFKDSGYIAVKVHNSIKTGDMVEIIRPLYDIISIKVDKLIDIETGKDISEAHGGQNKVIGLKLSKKIPEYSVIRRKLV